MPATGETLFYENKSPVVKRGEKGHSIKYRGIQLFLLKSRRDSKHYKVQVSRYSYAKDRMERIEFNESDRQELDRMPLGSSDLAIESMLEKICKKVSLDTEDIDALRSCIQRLLDPPADNGHPHYHSHHWTPEESRRQDRAFYRDMLNNSTRKDKEQA